MNLQTYINNTVHEAAVQRTFHTELGNVDVTYFPNLSHAYIQFGFFKDWIEADGPHHALEIYLQKYYWET